MSFWDKGIYGMSEHECMDVLCYFHGMMRGRLQMGATSPDSFIKAMANAVEFVKEKQTAKMIVSHGRAYNGNY
jgi:hypothetical protein